MTEWFQPVWVLGGLTLAVVLLSIFSAAQLRGMLVRMSARLLQEQAALNTQVALLGARAEIAEQMLREIGERLDHLELREPGDRSYAQAIRLVQRGADAEQLVSTCGLARSEAELMCLLHRMEKAG